MTINNGYLELINTEVTNSFYMADILDDGTTNESTIYMDVSAQNNNANIEIYNARNNSHSNWTHTSTYNTIQMKGTRSRIILQSSQGSGNLTIINQGTSKSISGLTLPTALSQAANKQYVDDFTTYCYYSSSLENPIYNGDIQLTNKTSTEWTFAIPIGVEICEITAGVTSKIGGNVNITLTHTKGTTIETIGTVYCYNQGGGYINTASRTWFYDLSGSNVTGSSTTTLTATISLMNTNVPEWWVCIKTISARWL